MPEYSFDPRRFSETDDEYKHRQKIIKRSKKSLLGQLLALSAKTNGHQITERVMAYAGDTGYSRELGSGEWQPVPGPGGWRPGLRDHEGVSVEGPLGRNAPSGWYWHRPTGPPPTGWATPSYTHPLYVFTPVDPFPRLN